MSALGAAFLTTRFGPRPWACSIADAASKVLPIRALSLTTTVLEVGVIDGVGVGVGVGVELVTEAEGVGEAPLLFAVVSAMIVPTSTNARMMIRTMSGHVHGLRFFLTAPGSSPSAVARLAVPGPPV